MYYLMNKDNVVATLQVDNKSRRMLDNPLKIIEVHGKLPFSLSDDFSKWLHNRKGSNYNNNVRDIMSHFNCIDNIGFIKTTHAATVNDTFWVKSDSEDLTWSQVSLYQNDFSEAFSKAAFESESWYDAPPVLPQQPEMLHAPELACEGSFNKCFRKENAVGEFNSNIFLYKRESYTYNHNGGSEVYCEQMASEIARIISPQNAVSYEVTRLYNKPASKCNLFSNEQYGYAPFYKLINSLSITFEGIFDYFVEIGSEQIFREMLVIDSLCFNQDRHLGNFGVLFNNDTLEIIRMAPIFDLNLTLLPYVTTRSLNNVGSALTTYYPRLGYDFTNMGQNALDDTLRDRVKDLVDFSFTFRGNDSFPPERVEYLENIVRRQAKAILSKEQLYTSDVFSSAESSMIAIWSNKENETAVDKLNNYEESIKDLTFDKATFTSRCISKEHIKYYIEKNQYLLTLDFLKGTYTLACNAKEINIEALESIDSNLYNVCKEAIKCFEDVLNKESTT